jgi:hypothetical protein
MPMQYENSTMQLDYIEYAIGIKKDNYSFLYTKKQTIKVNMTK